MIIVTERMMWSDVVSALRKGIGRLLRMGVG